MDRDPSKSVAFIVTFILSIFLLTSHKHVAPSSTQRSKHFQIDFEGSEVNTSNLITLNYDSNATIEFKLKKYKGMWKSELDCLVFASPVPNSLIYSLKELNLLTAHSQNCFKDCQNLTVSLDEKSKRLTGFVSCEDQEISIDLTEINKGDIYKERLVYGISVSFLFIGLLITLLKHFNKCNESSRFAIQTSVGSLWLLLLYFLFFSLWQMREAFTSDLKYGMEYILIPSFWSFLVFMILYSKILIRVFEASILDFSELDFPTRNHLISRYQSRVFLSVIFSMILISYFSDYKEAWIVLIHTSFFPQIIKNAVHGYKQSFSKTTYSTVLITQSAISTYYLVCHRNILKLKPNLILGVLTHFLLVFQYLILNYQQNFPRFLIPRKYRPHYYNYFKSTEEESLEKDLENICSICMTYLNIASQIEVLNFSRTMHTPCRHRFHKDCLLHWMEIKLECPTCRSKLPLYEGD